MVRLNPTTIAAAALLNLTCGAPGARAQGNIDFNQI
jgi:hypothetical protein